MFYIQDNNKIVLCDEDKQKLQDTIAFMPQYEGLEIQEVADGYVIEDFEFMTVEEQKQRQQRAERLRLDNLSMTRGDVFEALILAKGLGKAQIRAMIEQAELDEVTKALYLNRFDEALEFYRGYPIFDLLGAQLGITGEMLNKFFDTKDYRYLTTCTLTINTVPEECEIEYTPAQTVPWTEEGVTVGYKVNKEGYKEAKGIVHMTSDKTIEVVLDEDTNNTDELSV